MGKLIIRSLGDLWNLGCCLVEDIYIKIVRSRSFVDTS